MKRQLKLGRYIPDEEEFEESEVHAVATSVSGARTRLKGLTSTALQVPSDYVSPFFINNAMGHTKVKVGEAAVREDGKRRRKEWVWVW